MNARILSSAVMLAILVASCTTEAASADDHLVSLGRFTEYENLIQR